MKGKFTFLLLAFMATMFIADAQVKKPVAKKPANGVKKPVAKPAAKKPVAIVPKKIPGTRVKITTDSGVIIVRLYDSTPIHRDNFIKLVKEGFYDSLMFHRVIPAFMIQGGDPLSKNAEPETLLGNGGDDMERLKAEILPIYFHKRGVLAAARDGNPEKKSSACQFYIVEGRQISDGELSMLETQKGIKYTPQQKAIYKTIGGTPHLDGEYTVFGETEKGFEVISKIANTARDSNNRPLGDIRMKMEIIQ